MSARWLEAVCFLINLLVIGWKIFKTVEAFWYFSKQLEFRPIHWHCIIKALNFPPKVFYFSVNFGPIKILFVLLQKERKDSIRPMTSMSTLQIDCMFEFRLFGVQRIRHFYQVIKMQARDCSKVQMAGNVSVSRFSPCHFIPLVIGR